MSAEAPSDLPWFLPPSRVIAGFTVDTVFTTAGKTITLRVTGRDGHAYAMKIPVREGVSDRTWQGRFEREVQILRKLSGPCFPALRAHGRYVAPTGQEVPYIVTSMPIGPTVRDVVAQRRAAMARPDVEGAMYLLEALAAALVEVHALGIVHRNLRPDKIAIAGGRAQILDFVLGLDPVGDSLTKPSEFLGTPDYIAPEQARSPHDVDARVDLYALGFVMFEYVTYTRPFGHVTNKVDAFLKHITDDAPPPSKLNPEVPRDLDRCIERLMRRNRDERFASASAVIAHVAEMRQSRRAAALSHVCVLPESGVVDGHRVVDAITTSGLTTLLRVEDARGRALAMRVPAASVAGEATVRARFPVEVERAGRVAGPTFLQALGAGAFASGALTGVPYVLSVLPIGPTLREVLEARKARRGEPDVAGAPYLLRRLALAVAELHAAEIVGNGLRPESIAISPDGCEAQLLEYAFGPSRLDVAHLNSLVAMSVAYAAPELLVDGAHVDGRADLFSLGVVLYEYVTHSLPLGDVPSRSDMLMRQVLRDLLPPSHVNPAVPPQLDALIMRLLNRQPADRFGHAVDVVDAADALLEAPRLTIPVSPKTLS